MIKKIYLAAGCFWGVQKYFDSIDGIVSSNVGYAQGNVANPSYQQVCTGNTNHTETIEIEYDDQIIDLVTILDHYFHITDPFSLNQQGHDIGTQYRSGIYYLDSEQETIVKDYVANLQQQVNRRIVVETLPFSCFYLAEEYHQKYLNKNPTGYCHFNVNAKLNSFKK
ncbi:peptide-methionine (S)-S-oxide reductase MsrA [Ureaplasma diversum]|uniref:Peptide methionine sulfoxide reductase MsrA n=1 Tax=Ureaplasma diversum NCTC 246 TaxID=1188241 RepID=A0A084EXQ7_9BACT|nr:peptide-methionine (S)-S-oxide reductase MsrA [Ureaplasma diversum]KEZ22749.1 Peptide methionine sulfoxide reductase [Ureaplasma diversum NCTC 246]